MEQTFCSGRRRPPGSNHTSIKEAGRSVSALDFAADHLTPEIAAHLGAADHTAPLPAADSDNCLNAPLYGKNGCLWKCCGLCCIRSKKFSVAC